MVISDDVVFEKLDLFSKCFPWILRPRPRLGLPSTLIRGNCPSKTELKTEEFENGAVRFRPRPQYAGEI